MSEQIKNPNEIVVADLYEVPRMHGELMPESKRLRRKANVVTRAYVDFINQNTEDNQRIMVIDEKATKKNQADREAKKESRKEEIAIKKAVEANLIGKAIGKIVSEPVKKETKTETEK